MSEIDREAEIFSETSSDILRKNLDRIEEFIGKSIIRRELAIVEIEETLRRLKEV